MKISIIAAMAKNRVIGLNNALPKWHMPGDLKRFKRLTVGKVVIMGRKTFESLGKPLLDRWNIVVTSNTIWAKRDERSPVFMVTSFEEGLDMARALNPDGEEVVVIGGAMLYESALPIADRMYLTELDEIWKGDTFFPEFEATDWITTEREDHGRYSFFVYDRKPKPVVSEATNRHTAIEGTRKTMGSYEELGREVGALVDVKNEAYGSAFDDAGEFLKLLYPNGIQPVQYADALALVRIFDKMKRIATDKDAFGESPYRDISGYGLLGLNRVEKLRATLRKAHELMETKYQPQPRDTEVSINFGDKRKL